MNNNSTPYQSIVSKETNDVVDALEFLMVTEGKKVECEVTHNFIPGFYIRTIFMPAGTLVTSRIHLTRHCYHISFGEVKVWINGEWQVLKAPFSGITQAGTRRVLETITDVIWTTFHQTDKTTVEEVEDEIIEKHENQFLEAGVKNNMLIHGEPN